jgi:class 3 adenylate cyclase
LNIGEDQLPKKFRDEIEEQLDIYSQAKSITVKNEIPDTNLIPIEKPTYWLQIPDIICIYVDMISSTKLSAGQHPNSTAGAYQLFTGTAVNLFHLFEAPYIDIRGDGVFALFNSNQPFRAIAAAVTFKTFAHNEFVPSLRKKTGLDEIGAHIGIDQKTVLVKRIGLKRHEGRTDRQNEVWAGKPVNMAAKLASEATDNQLMVSDRYFSNIQNDLVTKSCGCPRGEKGDLWSMIDLSEDNRFDFDKAYRLDVNWCGIHGKEYCEAILKLDDI